MVGLPYDLVANPLGAVRLMFEKAVASGFDPVDGKDWGASDLFRQFLFDDAGISQVPMFNSSTIKWIQPNTLVRFRGMIQDMLGNELYVGAYKNGGTWKTNKFADASCSPIDFSPDNRIWDRQLLYCIPVPGQNIWTEYSQEADKDQCTNSLWPKREKRQREDDAIKSDIDMDTGLDLEDSCHSKKMREDDMSLEPLNMLRILTEGNSSSVSLVPDVEGNSFSCAVKIYDSVESELKLNDVFEFVGVFNFDPDVTVDRGDVDELVHSINEDKLVHFPAIKVPQIHCVIHRKLVVDDFLSRPTLELKLHSVKELRAALLEHLATVLGNDRVAAEYMLLHLLSKIHARVDAVALGKLSLNLTCLNRESVSIFGNHIKLAIGNLLPFTKYLPLTVDFLNTVSFAPKKDYNNNRLVSGFLQLAEGSHLIIDETHLQAGVLNPTGVENARVLKSLMELQKVEYDFTYYRMEMPADVQLLVLSEGKSNILPADLILPVRPSSVHSPSNVDGEMLKAWRWYLGTMKLLPHSIDSNIQKKLEDDLVAARQADRNLGSQEFSSLLTMGRLMSASFGETHLSMEHWQMVKKLETIRRERLKGNM